MSRRLELDIAKTLASVAAAWCDNERALSACDEAYRELQEARHALRHLPPDQRRPPSIVKLEQAHRKTLATFTFGPFIVRCRPERAAIEAVAAKFKRGFAKLKGPGCKPWTPEQTWRDLKVVGPYDWRKLK